MGESPVSNAVLHEVVGLLPALCKVQGLAAWGALDMTSRPCCDLSCNMAPA